MRISVSKLLTCSVIILFLWGFRAKYYTLDSILAALIVVVAAYTTAGWLTPSVVLFIPWITAFFLIALLVTKQSGSIVKEKTPPDFKHLGVPLVIFSSLCALVNFYYWKSLADGSPGATLKRLLSVWDFGAHFSFFKWHTDNKGFISNVLTPAGDRWFGSNYPTGPHHLVANLLRTYYEVDGPFGDLVKIFSLAFTASASIAIFISGLAFARLVQNKTGFIFAIIATLTVAYFITFGPLSQTYTRGFVNLPFIVVVAVLSASFGVKPARSTSLDSILQTCCVAMMAACYFPALMIISPFFLAASYRFIRNLHWPKSLIPALINLILLWSAVKQISISLSLGVDHLNAQGGVTPLNPLLRLGILTVIFGSLSIRLCRILIASVAISIMIPISISYYVFKSTQIRSYYPIKIELIFFCVGLFILFTGLICSGHFLRSRSALGFGSLYLLFLLYFSGVPSHSLALSLGTNAADGVGRRTQIMDVTEEGHEIADRLIEMASSGADLEFDLKQCIIPVSIQDSLANTNEFRNQLLLEGVWLHALMGSFTSVNFTKIYAMSDYNFGTHRSFLDTYSPSRLDSRTCLISDRHSMSVLMNEIARSNPNYEILELGAYSLVIF